MARLWWSVSLDHRQNVFADLLENFRYGPLTAAQMQADVLHAGFAHGLQLGNQALAPGHHAEGVPCDRRVGLCGQVERDEARVGLGRTCHGMPCAGAHEVRIARACAPALRR